MPQYEENTVEELREELRARDLPVSGHKDELVARLEENEAGGGEQAAAPKEEEAAPEVEETAPGGPTPAVREEVEEQAAPEDYYPPMVYSPYELPANTAAAQAFADAHPEAVDPNLTLPPEQQAMAEANIQDHVDAMAEVGVIVEDPRLSAPTAAKEEKEEAKA